MSEIVLYDYWRSSASYRVRIALNLLGLPYRAVAIDLLTAAHRSPEHLERNPQGFVPAIEIDGELLTQSLAIIEYLHETRGPTDLLPDDPMARARVRQVAHAIAMDIHPVCNMSVVRRIVDLSQGGDEGRQDWMQEFIGKGLDAVEAMLAPVPGRFCLGDSPSMADCCLVPQLFNARRWGCDLGRWPRLQSIDANCGGLDAFRNAHPDAVGAPAASG